MLVRASRTPSSYLDAGIAGGNADPLGAVAVAVEAGIGNLHLEAAKA